METITELFGIERPIIQAPMAGVQDSALTLSVCEAGGLGSLPCAMLSVDALRDELEIIKAKTSSPYNLNFFCHTMPSPSPFLESKKVQAWDALFAPYYAEFDLPLPPPIPPSRMPFNQKTAELIAAYSPPVVSFHFGLPPEEIMAFLRRFGVKIIASATTVPEAIWLEARGVDAIIAQGSEAGGHRGMFLTEDLSTQMGTFALLPQIQAAVRLPVIAAGGIAHIQGVRAAFDLGAAGVQVGTAYLLCPEAKTSAVHRSALKSPQAAHTALTNLFSGRPARGIVNRLMQEQGFMNDKALPFPFASGISAALRVHAESKGSGDFSPLWAGQNVTGCSEVPASRLTKELTDL